VRARRGVALLAALWLVVAIALVALQFSLDAHERRALGIAAADRGVQRAAASGALMMTYAKLDYALRTASTARNVGGLRSSDPWLGVDSLYSGTVDVDSIPVDVRARDLGTQLNINDLTEDEFRTFFTFLLKDNAVADGLAQAIMDWRDLDDMPRPRGAERDDYIKAGLLALPANGPFREVEDLLNVKGMTPEIYDASAQFFTVRGNGTVNLNSAPAPVLRTLPGMTDAILAQILGLRSQGRRIQSVAQVMGAVQRGRAMSPGLAAANAQATQRLAARSTVDTQNIELIVTARVGPQAQAAQLIATVARGTGFPVVQWR
jgi:general secretion pathway protein K